MVSTSPINSADPAWAYVLTEAKTAMEMAVVGPDTRCHEEPNSAAMIAGVMAA